MRTVFEIAIDGEEALVTTKDEAERAVDGTGIRIRWKTLKPGRFLAELPLELKKELRRRGSFEFPHGSYYIMCRDR